MAENRSLYIGKKRIETLVLKLSDKSLVVLKGSRGYIMCGYLNLEAAQKFKDAAVKIVGVSSIKDALNAKVFALTSQARRLGIRKGQSIKEALKLIA